MDAKPPRETYDSTRLDSTRLDSLEERYRQTIEQVKDYAIFSLDNEGRVVSWNGGAERVLGFSEAEVLGQGLRLYLYVPEERERGQPQRELEQARYEGTKTEDCWHLRKDGSHFFASGVLTALRDDQGTPDGYTKSYVTSPGSAKPRRKTHGCWLSWNA